MAPDGAIALEDSVPGARSAGAAGLIAVGAGAAKLGIDWQQGMATLSGQAHIPVAAANQIGAAFKSTSGSTTFSAQEMVQAYSGVAAQLGVVQGHALSSGQALSFMKASTQLAEASGQSLSTTTSDVSTVLQTYGMNASHASDVSAVLFNTSRKTGIGMDTLVSTMQRLHSSLGAAAPSLKESGGLLLDLAAHGETGRAAISALSTGYSTMMKQVESVTTAQQKQSGLFAQLPANLRPAAEALEHGKMTATAWTDATKQMGASQGELATEFASSVADTQKAKDSYGQMGFSLTDAKGKFIGMKGVISEMAPVLKGMTQQQQLATVQQVFGATAGTRLLNVIKAGPAAYDKYTKSVADKKAAEEAAAKQEATLHGQMEILKATVLNLGASLGSVLVPILSAVGKALAGATEFLLKHKAALVAVAVVAGGFFATAIGVFAVNKIVSFGKSLGTAVQSLQEAGPKLASAGSKFIDWGSQVGKGALSAGKAVLGWLADFGKMIAEAAIKGATWVATTIAEYTSVAASAVTEAAATAAAWVAANVAMIAATGGIALAIGALVLAAIYVAKHWKQIWTDIKNWFADAVKFLRSGFGTLVILITGPIAPLLLLALHWKQVWTDVKNWTEDAVHWIKGHLQQLAFIGGPILAGIVYLATHWKQVWTDIKNWTMDAVHFVESVPGRIMAGLRALPGLLLGLASNAWNGFLSTMESIGSTILGYVTALPGRFISGLSNLAGDLLNIAHDAWTHFLNGCKDIWNDVWTWVAGRADAVLRALGDVGSWLLHAGEKVMEGFLSGLKSAYEHVKNFVGGIAHDIMSLKGPLEYDRTILVPHGNAVMQGFGSGLQEGYAKHVIPVVSGVAGALRAQLSSAQSIPTASNAFGIGGPSAAGGASPTVVLSVMQRLVASVEANTEYLQKQTQLMEHSMARSSSAPRGSGYSGHLASEMIR